ncbi:hypothetical protein CAEBREN_20542 [Caenorhabditis brenneri]|uniref:Receptor L-domain domain-containing protein n=1 Tax=Caenorhabditis brenneri TaxID=135651 RepID=G0NYV3_CAEBE|nr:hypothetical protein CAEBREN_20542 [Caenorhabditis brenneri]
MKFSFLKTIIFISLSFQAIIGQTPDKRCNGDDASKLQSGCVVIENSKLIFTDYDNEDAIFNTLSTVLRVENGVEVIGTTLENFDYLSNVEEIKNPDGPALLFKNNKELKRITLENLKVLGGKKEDVLFDQDNFPVTAYDDPEAFYDLLGLEAAARAFHGTEKCTEAFIKIIPLEPPGYGWLLYLSICLCAGITGFVAYQAIRLLKLKGKLGKKSGGKYVDDQEAEGEKSKLKKRSRNLRLFGMKINLLAVPVCILFVIPSAVANLKVFTQECISKV